MSNENDASLTKVNKFDKTAAIGALLLYTVISSVFTLISKLVNVFFMNNGFEYFAEMDLTWVIMAAVLIVIMSLYIKKNKTKYRDLFKNPMLLFIVGLILIIEGVLSLSNSISMDIISTRSAIAALNSMGSAESTSKLVVVKMLVSFAISIIITLLQIITGIIILSFGNKEARNRKAAA